MRQTIASFTLIKNEAEFIGAHLANVLPHIDEMVFFDGNSTDGTIEILQAFKARHPHGHKIKLFLDKDPIDLGDDYVRLFNECLHSASMDLAVFLHPDFHLENPEALRNITGDSPAYSCHMTSYAGEPGGKLYRINGRGEAWKNIYRMKPDLGAHYHGHYGAANEDVYFSEITGDEHKHHGTAFHKYPYTVTDSGLKIHHFSDVRSFARRLGRMKSCLLSQGYSVTDAERLAPTHPRVTLKDGMGFSFSECEYPEAMIEARMAATKLIAEAVHA